MYFRIFFQQLRRNRRHTLLNGLLLAAVTAFFCMSVNLYRNSVVNLAASADAYRTIAVMELKGDINARGELTAEDSDDYVGFQPVGVRGYDLSHIVSAEGVLGYDLRSRYGAYVPGETMMTQADYPAMDWDVRRFTIGGEEPVTMHLSRPEYPDFPTVELILLDEGSGWYDLSGIPKKVALQTRYLWENHENYADEIRALNREGSDAPADHITLYPGVEYIGTFFLGSGFAFDPDTGKFALTDSGKRIMGDTEYGGPMLDFDEYGLDHWLEYTTDGEERHYHHGLSGQPFWLWRWEDVQNDPEVLAYFEEAKAAADITMQSFAVTLTNDISGIPAFHLGSAFLYEGRMITREEYESGAKVCMISREMAQKQGWALGHKLDLNLYAYEGFANVEDTSTGMTPIYHQGTGDLYPQGEYEIVGIYDRRMTTGNSNVSESSLAMSWCALYIPENSVAGLPEAEPFVHGGLLTIWLDNDRVDDFLSAMDGLGICQEQPGRYQAAFTIYDQGYSLILPSLEAMHSTAELMLALSSTLMAVTCVLTAFFFAHSQKQSVGIFRMLGGGKAKAACAVLACALCIALVGGSLGALAGQALTEETGRAILADNLRESEETAAFRAFVLADHTTDTQGITVTADPALILRAALSAFLFPLLTGGFVLLYIHKEPRALLPRGEG